MKRQSRPDDAVLEVGYGNGYTTAPSVSAIDFSEAMIERGNPTA